MAFLRVYATENGNDEDRYSSRKEPLPTFRACVISLSWSDMDIVAYRSYCLQKPGVSETFPFDESTLVYKVMGKMFALTNVDTFESINLKCDPATALQLRELYEGVSPGYYMNKKHWNTIKIDGRIPDLLICQWIDDSYSLVVEKLPKADRAKFV